MKKKRLNPHTNPTVKAACQVSAAALMLGVSHAATVGFNFQTHYCAADSYSGAVVTGPAFGIGTNAWESLSQMDTGYGCDAGYYVLTQTVDTSSSAGGLNPLPNGSLSLTWSGYTANVSGFGGYSRSGPHYDYGGNGYKPGNEQVYWGFIRDGVNFGPGSSGGDNNQPGYSIDIVGLKTLFTNSPFAVQLIASSDSMQYLTNAFIIDATANTTQSVVYPSTPPVNDHPDTTWVRGVGGGLSTASGAVDTDHLKIIGNRAAHAGDKTTGFNFASTIAGFILTDKPVLTMPPNPVVVGPGDTVVWSGYAVGVPPLAYQWRRDGVAIPGATTSAFGLTNVAVADLASYDLVVTNLYGSASSGSLTIDRLKATAGHNYVLDSKPAGIAHDGLDFSAQWAASNNDGTTSRSGVMQFVATNANQIIAPANGDVSGATNGSIVLWMRSSATVTNTGHSGSSGDGAMLLDYRAGSGLVVVQTEDGNVFVQSAGNSFDSMTTANSPVSDNKWHQVAVTYGQTAGDTVSVYIDGQLNQSVLNSKDWAWTASQEIELGSSHDSYWQKYDGLLDDVRFYNRVLTQDEIGQVKTGAIVDTNALVLWYTFDAAPASGVTIQWQVPDAILQSSDTVNGPYADLPGILSPYPVVPRKNFKFYRHHGHTPATVVANPYLM